MGDVHPDDPVRGRVIDDQGRCIHGDGKDDVVCLRFPDDDWTFWACRQCRDDELGVTSQPWGAEDHDQLALQCGICRSIVAIGFAMERLDAGDSSCPHCDAPWNGSWVDALTSGSRSQG